MPRFLANGDAPATRRSVAAGGLLLAGLLLSAEAVAAHLEKGTPYDLELRLRHRDGSYRWFRGRGRATRDAEGRPVRMVGSLTDIEDQKRMAAELLQAKTRLEVALESLDAGLVV